MPAKTRLIVAVAATAMLLAACGGDASPVTADDVVSAESSTQTSPETQAVPAASSDGPAPAGGSTGTLTLSSGETYPLTVLGCETQANDPTELLIDDYVDVWADTPDGLRFVVLHAQTRASSGGTPQVELRSERPDGGGSPEMEYHLIGAGADPSLVTLVVDGLNVSGQAVLDGKFSKTKPLGDTVNASFDITCG